MLGPLRATWVGDGNDDGEVGSGKERRGKLTRVEE
jgi:hypothetical protein